MSSIWITDSQDEQSLEDFFRDSDQIHIPIFQREYVWGKTEFESLCHDISLIKDTVEKSQFLGAIVAYERPRPTSVVGRMKELDVVDGQQRLLTLYIFVLAIAESVNSYDEAIASELIQEFLLLKARRGLEINTRIVPSFKDRNQFRAIWDRVNSPELLKPLLLNNPPYPPLPSGESNGNLEKQYFRIINWLKKNVPDVPSEAIKYFQDLLEIITRKLTFVHLKLTDASVATKIFERLNYRGVRVRIIDLVRNEVFSKSDNAQSAIEIYETVWRPFESKFKNLEESFFFPYCLIFNSNIKKSELFSELRIIWGGNSPQDIINHMAPYQKLFMYLETGIPQFEDKQLNNLIVVLHKLNIPSAIYPFLLKLLYEYEKGNVEISVTKSVLSFVESFIVRRAILGYEPTGLHALFKGMWNEIGNNISVESLKNAILNKPTIQYPNDREIKNALFTRQLAKAKICNFLLTELDKSFPGDNPNNEPTIEHILPQTYKENSKWAVDFTKEEHKLNKDLFANLIPLSSPLNSSIQAADYETKKERYKAESMFKTPRILGEDYAFWNKDSIKQRTEKLCIWVLSRWKA